MPINRLINNADIEKVSEGLLSVKNNCFINKMLLSPTNPLLCNNPGGIIKNQVGLSADSLKEYMSVCTFVHTIDGWSYLSNAINAFLNGEPSITVHLSYYAELRAAMALLCTEGILIANNEQACIDSSNNIYIPSCQPKSMRITRTGTHSATWDIINEWILNSTKQTNVLEYFTYKGRTFKELISFIPHAANTNSGQVALVKKWLQTWCFDIRKYEEDREGRNTSSYNANIARNFTPNNLRDSLSILNEFWLLLEPSADNFSKLDQYLFALYLKEVYNNAVLNGFSITKDDFIKGLYNNSGLTEDLFLSRVFINDEESSLLKYAKDHQIDPGTGEVHSLTIIARAILLLRFCCGACSFLFKKNSISKNDLDFYIHKVGQSYGIWDTVNPEDLRDLWTDINDLLIDFEQYFEANTPSNIYNLKTTFTGYSEVYTQFSRAGLWGLGL